MIENWVYGVSRHRTSLLRRLGQWTAGVQPENPGVGISTKTLRGNRNGGAEDQGLIHEITTSVSYGDDVVWVATYFGDSHYDGATGYFLTKTAVCR